MDKSVWLSNIRHQFVRILMHPLMGALTLAVLGFLMLSFNYNDISKLFEDVVILALYASGDQNRSHQTKHDITHVRLVMDVAIKLAAAIHALYPNMMSEHVQKVIIPLAAFLHDIGGGIDADNHAEAGAIWAREYLLKLGFDDATVTEICRIIAGHRSEVALGTDSFKRPDFADAAYAIVVIADKAVGDEERVRPEPAAELARLREAGKMSEFQGSDHDRVTYSIKSSDLVVDGSEIVLKLRIDEEVAAPELIYSLYGKRFHGCGKAAQYLGFAFRLEFNGVRFYYDEGLQSWQPFRTISATMPEDVVR